MKSTLHITAASVAMAVGAVLASLPALPSQNPAFACMAEITSDWPSPRELHTRIYLNLEGLTKDGDYYYFAAADSQAAYGFRAPKVIYRNTDPHGYGTLPSFLGQPPADLDANFNRHHRGVLHLQGNTVKALEIYSSRVTPEFVRTVQTLSTKPRKHEVLYTPAEEAGPIIVRLSQVCETSAELEHLAQVIMPRDAIKFLPAP